ncbi:MAG: hypothetical protein V4850_33755 [Myxococcota bacterium]
MDADDSEAEISNLIAQVSRAVPHPTWTDLVYHDTRELTAEQVVDEALAYGPVLL